MSRYREMILFQGSTNEPSYQQVLFGRFSKIQKPDEFQQPTILRQPIETRDRTLKLAPSTAKHARPIYDWIWFLALLHPF